MEDLDEDPFDDGLSWYWAEQRTQRGPVSTLQLIGMYMNDELGDDNLVWCPGMDGWAPFGSVEDLQLILDALPPKRPKTLVPWLDGPGSHAVPEAFHEWVDHLDPPARLSLFRTALCKYVPAALEGLPEARNAFLRSYITRHPDMEGDPDHYEMSGDFMADVLEECVGLPNQRFQELLVDGNEAFVMPVMHAAARLDERFVMRVHNAHLLGRALASLDEQDADALTAQLSTRPGLVNSRNLDGTCMLHRAAAQDGSRMLNALLTWASDMRGLDLVIDVVDAQHNTPLHIAVAKGNTDAARLLLEAKADVNAQNHETSKYTSGQWSKRTAGDDCEALLPDHQTPSHIAAEQADAEMLELLLEYGPRLDVRDSGGLTALDAALEQADEECVQLLLEAGADSRPAGAGPSPLHSACSRGLAAIVGLLLQHAPDLDVDAEDGSGWRPLHLAARKGSLKTVQLLLRHGADAGARNSQGQTALHLAEVNNKTAVVDALRAHAQKEVPGS